MEAAPGAVAVEICCLLVCLAMGSFQAAPGVEALLDGADLAVEADGEALVKAGETVAGVAVVGIVRAVENNPVMDKDSDGEVKVKHPAGVVVELLSVEAALHPAGQNAPGDPLALPVGTLALLLSVEVHQILVGENVPGAPLAVNLAAGVHLEVLAGEDLLLTVVVGLMDNKAGAVAELVGVHHRLVEIGVLKVPLVPKAFTLKWMAKLFKPVTQFLSGTMLMVVQPV